MDSAARSFPVEDTSQGAPSCCKGSTGSIFHSLSRTTIRDRSNLRDEEVVIRELQRDHVSDATLLTPDCTRPPSSTLTTMSYAHVAEHATVATVSRYSHTSSNFHMSDPTSPSSSESSTAFNSRVPSPSLEDPRISQCISYSLKWRLASGYFAYFVLGWADGGECQALSSHPSRNLNSIIFLLVTGTVIPCKRFIHRDRIHQPDARGQI